MNENVEDLRNKYTSLLDKREKLNSDLNKKQGELKAAKENLEKLKKESIDRGYDPKKIPEEIDKQRNFIEEKLSIFENKILEVDEKLKSIVELET